MISAGDFRNGVTFEEDGNVLQVIEFQHVKPGKGFCRDGSFTFLHRKGRRRLYQ